LNAIEATVEALCIIRLTGARCQFDLSKPEILSRYLIAASPAKITFLSYNIKEIVVNLHVNKLL